MALWVRFSAQLQVSPLSLRTRQSPSETQLLQDKKSSTQSRQFTSRSIYSNCKMALPSCFKSKPKPKHPSAGLSLLPRQWGWAALPQRNKYKKTRAATVSWTSSPAPTVSILRNTRGHPGRKLRLLFRLLLLYHKDLLVHWRR